MQQLCHAPFCLQLVASGFPFFNLNGCLTSCHAPRISCSKSTNKNLKRFLHSYSLLKSRNTIVVLLPGRGDSRSCALRWEQLRHSAKNACWPCSCFCFSFSEVVLNPVLEETG